MLQLSTIGYFPTLHYFLIVGMFGKLRHMFVFASFSGEKNVSFVLFLTLFRN